MDVTELFGQNPWWKDKKLIEEDYNITKWKEKKFRWTPKLVNEIELGGFALHIITGPRQVGKTTILKLLIKKLLEKKEAKEIFFFNCEDIADYKELLEIINTYLEFREENSIKKSVMLLDEVTLPKEWYRAIKSLIDKGKLKNDAIIITGSSSIEIKKETEMFPGRRGKGQDYIIYPLSFREFLKVMEPKLVQKIKPAKRGELGQKALNSLLFEKELSAHLKKYMEYGGFPLSIANLGKEKEEAKKAYLSWIKNSVLKAERSDVIARQIMKTVLESLQSDVSWESISRKIEIKSPKTVAAYIELMQNNFTVNVLYNIDVSEKKIRFGRNKKIHLKDPLLLEIFEDWCLVKAKNREPAIAEALVAEHLSRMYPEKTFFWKNGSEIDVVVLENEKLYGFEVKWREKTPIVKSPNQIKETIIITKNEYTKKPLQIPLAVFLSMLET
jgi:uncharacterized protein